MDAAESSLRRVLTLLNHDWIYNFLYPPDPATDLDLLRHALDHPNPMSANFAVSTPVSPDPNAHLYSLDEQLRLLFIPSFSTAAVTVGFEINDRIRSAGTFSEMHRYVAKTVRDDEHGYLFTFVEHPEKGITQIAYYIQITPAFRERNVLLFHTHAFRNAVHALRAGGYDREAMRRALTYCFYSAEMRACPKCNARVITECKCKLVIQRKTHHLDHAGEWRNLASYGGEYEGMASLGIYENGRNVFRANYVARVSGALTMDGDCQRGLSKWAMCDAARKRRVNVLKLCMPDLNEVQVAKLLPASEHPNPPKHMPHLIEDASKPKQHQDTYSVGSNYSAAPSTDDGLPRAGSPHREMLEAGEASDREPTVVDVSNMQDKSAVRGAALKPLQPTPVLVDPQIQKRKLVSLAPAPSASAIDGDEFMDERQQRLEARKARNRESALRSNHRKKIALQELKDNIKEVLEREVHLRKREAELREENAMLKSSLMR